MDFQILRCPYCGSEGRIEKRDELWFCAHCANTFSSDTADSAFERIRVEIGSQLRGAIDDALYAQREEQYYNLRSLLWEKVYAKYTDSAAIVSICRDIKKLAPHDFLACFFEIANSATAEEVSRFINDIAERENEMFIDIIIDFMIRSLNSEYVMPVSYLIERAYKNKNLQKFEDMATRLEKEAAKIDSGIYSTIAPRDVFIAYSSKDIETVIELMTLLENNGLSCFVALRNLQHGRGAVANYRTALREAIDNSKTIVFISSKNSRSFACDALKEELRYIRESELRAAPPEFRNDYSKLPAKYKKQRIEYRIDNAPTPAVDGFMSEFFSGLDFCESAEKVLTRIAEYILNDNVFVDATPLPSSDAISKTPVTKSTKKSKPAEELPADGDYQKNSEFEEIHEHNYQTEKIAPSCVSKGYLLHKCSCGYEYKDNFKPTIEHDYRVAALIPPSCTKKGKREYSCTMCGAKKSETLPTIPHNFGEWIERTHPTCLKSGEKVRQCTICGFTEEQKLSEIGHRFGQWQKNEQGIETRYCLNCGYTETDKSSYLRAEELKKQKSLKIIKKKNKQKIRLIKKSIKKAKKLEENNLNVEAMQIYSKLADMGNGLALFKLFEYKVVHQTTYRYAIDCLKKAAANDYVPAKKLYEHLKWFVLKYTYTSESERHKKVLDELEQFYNNKSDGTHNWLLAVIFSIFAIIALIIAFNM